jgi:predicted transcriptional regulator YdeE
LSYELQIEGSLTVVGIFTRASNATPHLIGDLWRSFHAQGDLKTISETKDQAAYCVYCEYEGDALQPFTVVIGRSVDSAATVAEGMKKVNLTEGSYAVYRAEGELPQGVFSAWAEIWQTPLERRYQADYDRYDADGATVHVGVR